MGSIMAPRANWKGNLKLSLVSCGVALFPATRVINLMDALRRSVAGGRGHSAAARRGRRPHATSKRAAAGRKKLKRAS
jgi:non-homologous end joining protein Ku